ncbi:phytosulfokine receptor 1 [Magnolia sinica]|uniref:phytosulfokine receptor 1 n=1 Tax=Magnolia sinica TaxID=86752 RepID=UPI002659DCB8|nr:phytosulfokine receptor 1 [Magnolia sinica]
MGVGDFSLFFFILCFSLCLQSHVLNSQNLTCNSNDLKALDGFSKGLNSTVGAWSNASSSDCCSWRGVECGPSSGNSSRRVVRLSLGNMQLKGPVSKSLASLDQLKVLNLSFNSLHGLIPAELFKSQQLEVLDLGFNDFFGQIPLNISLPSIQVFNISGNSFTGEQPLLIGSVNLTHFIINYNLFSGSVNASICSTSPRIEVLQLSANNFSGNFPVGFGNCNSLHELSLNENFLSGNFPDDLFGMLSLRRLYLQENNISGWLSERIGNLSHLTHLDISLNGFEGKVPDVFSSLGKLQHLCAHSNRFNGQLPVSLSNLPLLRLLNLRNNSLDGPISLNCTAMAHLSSLDLGSNRFHGSNLDNLSSCKALKNVNLARNSLNVKIPESFKNLQALSYLSLSNNSLHNISSSLQILQQCRNLTTLVLTMNFHEEEMPVDAIQGFGSLKVLVIPNCGLSGSIPPWLANCSKLQLLDLSWNRLQGSIPTWVGSLGSLFYLDLSNNSLTGEIPKSLTQLAGLISRNVSQEESTPNFPFFIRRNQNTTGLQYNQVTSFRPTLDLSCNMLTGPILLDFGKLKKLHVLELRKNNLSGTIPSELSGMTSLEVLDLSFNNLSGTIPVSLTNLSFLSSFSVANNSLSGVIPTGGQFSTFPNASFKGNKDLCGEHFTPCWPQTPLQSNKKERINRIAIIGMPIGIGSGVALVGAFVYIIVLRSCFQRQEDTVREESDTEKNLLPGSKLVLLFQSKENKEITIEDLLKSTGNFDQANIIGCGGFGLVYKATLPDGRKVAIKRLSGDGCQMEREFQAEVETLSRAQHENLVLLQGYCRYGNDRLLIYSYMENGSLDYWLHEKLNGGSALDWDTRLRIAQGAARGLAYLHQSCEPHILHRDIKSSNILLDENFKAHLADFGLARLILPYDTHVTTDLVGTLGYIPPEYSQASVATFKGDVYSFGVVLLELLTGKRPMDMCKPKGCRDLTSWVLQMKKERREDEVFDPFIYDKEHSKQMSQVLDIACLCLSECPKFRPFIQQIVLWLDNVGLDSQPIT